MMSVSIIKSLLLQLKTFLHYLFQVSQERTGSKLVSCFLVIQSLQSHHLPFVFTTVFHELQYESNFGKQCLKLYHKQAQQFYIDDPTWHHLENTLLEPKCITFFMSMYSVSHLQGTIFCTNIYFLCIVFLACSEIIFD